MVAEGVAVRDVGIELTITDEVTAVTVPQIFEADNVYIPDESVFTVIADGLRTEEE